MENILVPVVSGRQDNRLIIHGMQLAERIGGIIYILEIDQLDKNSSAFSVAVSKSLKDGDEAWIANLHKKEVRCEYFQVKGDLCDEIFKFCHRYRITNLVLDLASIGKREAPARMLKMINSLKRRNGCRIELVGRKQERG